MATSVFPERLCAIFLGATAFWGGDKRWRLPGTGTQSLHRWETRVSDPKIGIAQKARRLVAWLPSISPGVWCEVPGRNLAAYSRNGLWLSDAATGIIVRGYNAPRAEGMAATKEKVFTRSGNGSVLEWVLPRR